MEPGTPLPWKTNGLPEPYFGHTEDTLPHAIWSVGQKDDYPQFVCCGDWEYRGAPTSEERVANLRYIAHACNNFEALLSALKLYFKLDNDRHAGVKLTDADWAECHHAAERALSIAQAEGR
jgi:hypothetical protein